MSNRSLMIAAIIIGIIGSSYTGKLVQTELYFGLSQPDGNRITDSAWNVFVRTEVTNVFPEGFTIIASEGMWADRQYHQMHREPSRVIITVNKMTPKLSVAIDRLRNSYKKLFEQESVLRVDKKATVNF